MSNNTTPDLQPLTPRAGLPYMLIPFLGLTLLGILVALGAYIRRRQRIDELRHKLIPLYSYDPSEQDLDSEEDRGDNEDELTQPFGTETGTSAGSCPSAKTRTTEPIQQ